MVLVESIDTFVQQAEALYKQDPLKSRYVIKYSHSKGRLVLKVTDDRNTVQYKTDQQTDLKKVIVYHKLSRPDCLGVQLTLSSASRAD